MNQAKKGNCEMKKRTRFGLIGLACLLLGGCAKQESAQEIMTQVEARSAQNETVQTIELDGKMSMAAQGMTLDFPLSGVIQTQPLSTVGEPAIYFEMGTTFLGQAMTFSFFVQDQTFYSDMMGERSIEPFISSDSENDETQSIALMFQKFSVEKTSEGYRLSYQANSFSELQVMLESLIEETGNEEALNNLREQWQGMDDSVTLEACTLSYDISKEYQMTRGELNLAISTIEEEIPTRISFTLTLLISTDKPMTRPDLSGWQL